jgi:hypothetical protein
MNSGGPGTTQEHHFTRVIRGDVDSVRVKIVDVLEEFHYSVVGHDPIQGKRLAQKNLWVAHTLEYETHLTVLLRPKSAASTLATFDYAVPVLFTNGDRRSLEREADAIIALATAPAIQAACPSCETENAAAVRFCRACGTPLARNSLPAELEVMRMTANATAVQQEISISLAIALLTLVISAVLLNFGKVPTWGVVVFVIGELIALRFLIAGLRRLHRTINPLPSSQKEYQPEISRSIPAHEKALPAPPLSVTEGTTKLIANSTQPPASIIGPKDTDPIQ